MKRLVVALALLTCASAGAETPDRVDRLVGLARLWAAVKFFHPQLATRDLDWDGALIRAIPAVEKAADAASYRAALAGMLAVLDDPATTVEIAAPAPPAAPPTDDEWLVKREAGVVTIDLRGALGLASDYPRQQQNAARARTELAAARVAVIDLRLHTDDPELRDGAAPSFLEEIAPALPAVERWPVERRLVHRGYRSQGSLSSGGYESAFWTAAAPPPGKAPASGPSSVIFVADRGTRIQALALALQASGRAVLVSDGPIGDASLVSRMPLELPLGVKAWVRAGEIILPDGRSPPRALQQVIAADPMKAALELAARKKPALRPARGGPVPPPTVLEHNDVDPPGDFPDRERRLLAAMRFWAVLEYFFPYRAYMTADWEKELRAGLIAVESADTADAYLKALKRMAVATGDGHVGVFPAVPAKKRGAAPAAVRIVEGKLVIERLVDARTAGEIGLRLGDEIVAIDGRPATALLDEKLAVQTGSTEEFRRQRAAMLLFWGDDGATLRVDLRGGVDGKPRSAQVPLTAANIKRFLDGPPGPTYRALSPTLGYADLTRLTVPDVEPMLQALAGTRALILDMRGYPKGTAWALAPRLNVKGAVHAAMFLTPLVTAPLFSEISPEASRWLQKMPTLPPGASLYRGKVIVLIDDRAISQAEHSCLFFEAATDVTFIGTPTAGANGDVTTGSLPGGLRFSFTGQEPRHVDGRQLQRVGIQPQVTVRPTLKGIAAGRDEVLEQAIRIAEGH